MPIDLDTKEFGVMPRPKGWRALISWRWRLGVALKVEWLALAFSEWLAPELKAARE
jgi:hypothetical protein